MTEETKEQVQSVQQPVQEETTTIYASTNAVPFAAMIIPKKWALIGNVYPMTTIKPDPSLKSPKMDWNQMKWFENDNAQSGIDMEDLKQAVKTLKSKDQESNSKMDQLLQLSVRTNQVLGQLLTDKKKPSVTTTASPVPVAQPVVPVTQSVQPSTAIEGGKK